ncbi:MAG: hypothetical protein AAF750_13225 [Planctomycetota bacterium]
MRLHVYTRCNRCEAVWLRLCCIALVVAAVSAPNYSAQAQARDGAQAALLTYVRQAKAQREVLLSAFDTAYRQAIDDRSFRVASAIWQDHARFALDHDPLHRPFEPGVNHPVLMPALGVYERGLRDAHRELIVALTDLRDQAASAGRTRTAVRLNGLLETARADPPRPDAIDTLHPRLRVHRLVRTDFMLDGPAPDELRARLEADRVRVSGEATVDTKVIRGKTTGHFGKAVVLRGRDWSGWLRVAEPPDAKGAIYTLTLRDRRGKRVLHERLQAEVGTAYRWSLTRQGRRLRVTVGSETEALLDQEVSAFSVSEVVFGVTVRREPNRADLLVQFAEGRGAE